MPKTQIQKKFLPEDRYFKAKNLFSPHYLEERIKQGEEWKEGIEKNQAVFGEIKKLYKEWGVQLEGLNEAELRKEFITAVLEILGHTIDVNPPLLSSFAEYREPDYAFFTDTDTMKEAIKIRKKHPEKYFKKAIGLGEAKVWRIDLDKKPKSKGKQKTYIPNSQILDYLWKSGVKWGILTNGRVWRIYYREAQTMLESYYEIDLENIILNGKPKDFNYFYIFFRKEAFLVYQGMCFLDRIYNECIKYDKELEEDVKENVYDTLKILATGFLEYPNKLTKEDIEQIHKNTLILLYRLLFVLYAEARKLLPVDNKMYRSYSMEALKEEISKAIGANKSLSAHIPIYWDRLTNLFALINEGSKKRGIKKDVLFIPPYNGGLFDPKNHPFLEKKKIGDAHLARAVDLLTTRPGKKGEAKGYVDYAGLSIRHLGSIYEGLLEYKLRQAQNDIIPVKEKGKEIYRTVEEVKTKGKKIDEKQIVKEGELYLVTDKGERKATGSYYTPDYIVKYILKNTLEPLIEEKKKKIKKNRGKLVKELLSIKVLDPAMGSGHFLVEATDVLASAIVQAKQQEAKTTAELKKQKQKAKRQVVERCIFGVDLNPLAVELAKLSLWLHTIAKDKTLSFLDHHLKVGNSLIGAKTADLSKGLPSQKKMLAQQTLLGTTLRGKIKETLKKLSRIQQIPSDTPEQIKQKEEILEDAERSLSRLKELADVRTSTCFGSDVSIGDYEDIISNIAGTTAVWDKIGQESWFENAIKKAQEKRFFHWELEFPEVFSEGKLKENPGFDAVVGNPPWERVKLKENEFFALRDAEIAYASTAALRKRLIQQLSKKNPQLWAEYLEEKEYRDFLSSYFRNSGLYPLMGWGDVNYYAVFSEKGLQLTCPRGKFGFVVPSGIATDKTSKKFFSTIVESKRLSNLIDFENREGYFKHIHRSFKYSLIIINGFNRKTERINSAFYLHSPSQLQDQERVFQISPSDFALFNQNTKTSPVFRTRQDFELSKKIYMRVPILVKRAKESTKNPWKITFLPMFHMTNDSGLFRTAKQLSDVGYWLGKNNIYRKGDEKYLPLYEGKMLQLYDHRAASVVVDPMRMFRPGSPKATTEEEHQNLKYCAVPHFWVPEKEVLKRLSEPVPTWFISFKNVTAPTNERTMLTTIIPLVGVSNSQPLVLTEVVSAEKAACLAANLSSFVLDYVARQKVGGQNLNYFIVEQFPVLPPSTYDKEWRWVNLKKFISKKVLELVYTSHDISAFAKNLGYKKGPFLWDEERRLHLKCQLDALYFLLYGLNRKEVSFVLDTFPIVRERDEEAFGNYRTKSLIDSYYIAYKAGNMDALVKL